MRIGVLREIKPQERRVALTPAGAASLVAAGHEVMVERDAGLASGHADADYAAAGAGVVARDAIFEAELLVKVKEPQPEEVAQLRPQQLLFAYLHLAAEPDLAEGLLQRGVSAIAYETVQDAHDQLPLLVPMSEIAGRLAVQLGAQALLATDGGRGVLLGGAPGVLPARVLVLGGGVVGMEAARVASGLGAEVIVLERDPARLRVLERSFDGRVRTCHSDTAALEMLLPATDLLVGAVLLPGREAPKLLRQEHFARMPPGSVFVDVAIDQGGCAETSRPTTHREPTYRVGEVIHLCITNLPAACPRTSTAALTQATLPYLHQLAAGALARAIESGDWPCWLKTGLNVHAGELVHPAVAASLGRIGASLPGAVARGAA